MVNEMILQLVEEMVNPDEIALDEQVEDIIELEDDTLLGAAEVDDELIEFIANGGRLGYDDPIDFTDNDVDEALDDDLDY